MNRNKIVFAHFPKCGGSTLLRKMQNYLGIDDQTRCFHPDSIPGAYCNSKIIQQIHDANIIHGHFLTMHMFKLIKDFKNLKITTIRRPSDRLVSHCNFDILSASREMTSLNQYYQHIGLNPYSRWLCRHFPEFVDNSKVTMLSRSIPALKQFDIVLRSEDLNQFFAYSEELLGWTKNDQMTSTYPDTNYNTGGECLFEMDEEEKTIFDTENAADLELWKNHTHDVKKSAEIFANFINDLRSQ